MNHYLLQIRYIIINLITSLTCFFVVFNVLLGFVVYLMEILGIYDFHVITSRDMSNLILANILIMSFIGVYCLYKVANYLGLNYINILRKSQNASVAYASLSMVLLRKEIFEGVKGARIAVVNYNSHIENEGHQIESIKKLFPP